MREKYIFLCRHGYRDDTNIKFEKGDPGLNNLGIAQVKLLAKELFKYPINEIYSSPYRRTIETAEHISNKLNIKFNIENALAEWLNQKWLENKPILLEEKEIKNLFNNFAENTSINEEIKYEYPEHRNEMKKRIEKYVNYLECNDNNILLITHGTILTEIAARLTNINQSKFNWEICCLTILAYDFNTGIWKVKKNGSLRHLSKYIHFLR